MIKLNKPTKTNPLYNLSDSLVSDFTFDNFFEVFNNFIELKTLEGLAPRSIKDYINHMNYFKGYMEEQQRTYSIRSVEIDAFRSYIYYMTQEKQYKPCTINIRLRTLRAYLKWLYKENYLSEDFSSRIKLVKEPVDTILPLDNISVRKLLKQPDTSTYVGLRDLTIMVVMLDCGIRVGELVSLKVSDIDLKSKVINIRSEIAKSRTFRQVPLSSKSIKLLKEIRSIVCDSNTEYLFPSAYCNKLDTNQVIHNFRKYGQEAHINQRCTPHVLRHTFAVSFLKSGGDVFILQRILGHSTLEMTRRYVQLTSNDLIRKHKEVSHLDKLFK
ncbi:tyrosine-type recombinase/integrase [Clostridium sp. CCUG 7971]|uniref:tyrosine-type recombinase/integrase n=1 Tax=Clostridium sp. CCUG 7971 TaxID=2811414 RepID=UPI00336BD630